MTDRDMLELAAKAAGIEIEMTVGGLPWLASGKRPWNPLTDDGDALRLMVRLRLEPRFIDNSHSNGAEPSRVTLHNVAGIVENIDDDPLAATRRAITRAAAEIALESLLLAHKVVVPDYLFAEMERSTDELRKEILK